MDLSPTIDTAVAKITEVIALYGPKAAELTLSLGRVAALKDLAMSAAGVAVGAVILIAVTRPLIKLGRDEMANPSGFKWSHKDKQDLSEGRMAIAIVGGGLSGIAGVLLTSVNGVQLVNPILWVGLSHPEIYLAAKALNL